MMVNNVVIKRFEKFFLGLIIAALVIKIALFIHIACFDPASMMQNDSYGYLEDAKGWIQFFNHPSQGLQHTLYRTPGYTFFLAVFHLALNLPLVSIIFLQIMLNALSAFVVYRTVSMANPQAGLLSAAIVLLDLPTTIYSSMILTESLHMLVLSLFSYSFVNYINNRRLTWLAGAAVLLAASVYVRPVGYFLGIAIAGFVLYMWGIKKIFTATAHALMMLLLVYGLLAIWQYHNLKYSGVFTFSTINSATIDENGIIGRYARETDPQLRAMPPVIYYVHSIGQNFLNLMTTPGNMRHFHAKGWKTFGLIFGYPFVVFWWVGLIAGVRQGKADLTGQFMMLVLLYFISVSIVATGWHVTPRFRVPMMPFLAILSAVGWMALLRPKAKQA